ncbi:hypothetical protein [Streptomyces sp. SAJ15]|uniref:hypothetical protein n=1 Tax=Streptomyces sp. SAJ15 TaxID=2011095 RepID=UPI0021B3B26A|nr:hypothetical protein [Streptomyces sp. SAJ15]
MAVAATPLPDLSHQPELPDTAAPPALPTLTTLPKQRMPAGRPREWYEAYNRRLKAMRLAIALLNSGAYRPEQAPDHVIRTTAARIGVHPPSAVTCRMVRAFIHCDSR